MSWGRCLTMSSSRTSLPFGAGRRWRRGGWHWCRWCSSPSEWYERYERRVDAYRRPRIEAARVQHAECVGRDGVALLTAAGHPSAPAWLAEVPALRTLRAVWDQHYDLDGDQARWRSQKQL